MSEHLIRAYRKRVDGLKAELAAAVQRAEEAETTLAAMHTEHGRLYVKWEDAMQSLRAERQRAEAAEKDANELRADNEMNARYAARALHAEAALAAVLPDFYREVCAEAERIIESSGMVSGAHWNAMKIILERRGVQPEVQP